MLSRSERVSKGLFKEIMKKGEVLHSPFFMVRHVRNTNKSNHFGVSISGKIAKTAVLRNKIRRRVYSIISNTNLDYNGFSSVLIAKESIIKAKPVEITEEIKKIIV